MRLSSAPERPFECGGWQVDPARSTINAVSGGAEIRLEPRIFDLLLLFAGSNGQVLSKDSIVEMVWAGRAVGDDTLAAAISRLRKVLGECSDRRFIETIPKRGYRFLVDMGEAKAPPAPRTTSEADLLILKGEAAMSSPFGLNQAKVYFEAAVREAPTSAAAHAGLSAVLLAQRFSGGDSSLGIAAKSVAASAVALDQAHAPAWTSLGLATLIADRNFTRAEDALARAVAIDPGLAVAHRHRALAFATIGRFADAERASRRAIEIEPNSLAGYGLLQQILICARRYRAAAVAGKAAITLAPNDSEGWYARGWALVLAGDEQEGVDSLIKGLDLWGVTGATLAELRLAFGRGGLAALCDAGADLFEQPQLLFRPKVTDVALLRAAAGNTDRALAALDAAVASDDPWVMFLPWLPHLDGIRGDPRFNLLLSRARLVH